MKTLRNYAILLSIFIISMFIFSLLYTVILYTKAVPSVGTAYKSFCTIIYFASTTIALVTSSKIFKDRKLIKMVFFTLLIILLSILIHLFTNTIDKSRILLYIATMIEAGGISIFSSVKKK